jgi:hypothetical protein
MSEEQRKKLTVEGLEENSNGNMSAAGGGGGGRNSGSQNRHQDPDEIAILNGPAPPDYENAIANDPPSYLDTLISPPLTITTNGDVANSETGNAGTGVVALPPALDPEVRNVGLSRPLRTASNANGSRSASASGVVNQPAATVVGNNASNTRDEYQVIEIEEGMDVGLGPDIGGSRSMVTVSSRLEVFEGSSWFRGESAEKSASVAGNALRNARQESQAHALSIHDDANASTGEEATASPSSISSSANTDTNTEAASETQNNNDKSDNNNAETSKPPTEKQKLQQSLINSTTTTNPSNTDNTYLSDLDLDLSLSTLTSPLSPTNAATQPNAPTTLRTLHPTDWQPIHVQIWLKALGCTPRTLQIFEHHSVDGPALMGLTDRRLEMDLEMMDEDGVEDLEGMLGLEEVKELVLGGGGGGGLGEMKREREKVGRGLRALRRRWNVLEPWEEERGRGRGVDVGTGELGDVEAVGGVLPPEYVGE